MSGLETEISKYKEQIEKKEDANLTSSDRIKKLKEMLGEQKEKILEYAKEMEAEREKSKIPEVMGASHLSGFKNDDDDKEHDLVNGKTIENSHLGDVDDTHDMTDMKDEKKKSARKKRKKDKL